jgi:4-hydroxybenzoate polyprenyltransferase
VSSSRPIDWPAWWQILRAANVFTAASNVIAGYLLINHGWQPLTPLLLLIVASIMLYEAGMVLNDVCDATLDAKERPERPIPSGRVPKHAAKWVGVSLLVGGVLIAQVVSWLTKQWLSTQIALALAATIVGYNVGVKATRWGPLAMAGCRMMNVLLGASVAGTMADGWSSAWLLAWGLFFHTYGLTRIARHEADSIDHLDLWAGSVAVILALFWIVGLPLAMEATAVSLKAWILVWLALLSWEIYLAYTLLTSPSQMSVRQTVGSLIGAFLLIDSAVATLAAGWMAGLIVLSFWIPTMLLARRISMT